MYLTRWWIILIAFFFAGLLGLVIWFSSADIEKDEAHHAFKGAQLSGLLAKKKFGGPFLLIDQNGDVVRSATLPSLGRLIYFGFTYCPDVCPRSLTKITQVVDALEKDGHHVLPVFITIDPIRDTPPVLAAYLSHFHPKFIGLTGSREQLDKVLEDYRIFVQRKDNADSGTYLFDHTSFIFFTDSRDRVVGVFETGVSPEKISAAIAAVLE